MKKFLLVFFLGLQFLHSIKLIGQTAIDLSVIEKEWIENNDTVYFGYDPDWKPYEFINENGNHDGIVEPIIDIIRSRSGINLQPLPNQGWLSSVASLKSEKLQVLPIIAVTEDRLQFMDFTASYVSFSFVIINSEEGEFIGDINDLNNLKIALPRGYVITELIERDYPNFTIIYTNNLEEALFKILTKEADATIAGLPIASYYMNYSGFDHLQIATEVKEYDYNLHMSVLKGNDTLLSILEKSLNSISNKEKQEIINDWVTVKYEYGVDMTRIWKIAAICALIVMVVIGIIIFWNRSLQKQIAKRIEAEEKLQASLKEIHHQKLIVEEKSQEITDSIEYAKTIQSAILPSSKVIDEFLKDSFVLYKPKDIVAGDFYWMKAKADRILFAVADCTGHGVPGAMISVVCNNALNRSVREFNLSDPGQILDKARDIVIQEFEKSETEVRDGMDIAICSLIEDKLEYAGAHNPLWIIRNGILIETKANKQPIGKFENLQPYKTHSFQLEKGDTIYIFSDGYSDQFGGIRGKKYKTTNFKNFLLSIQENSMEKQFSLLDAEFEKWRGSMEQIDDVCVIGLRI